MAHSLCSCVIINKTNSSRLIAAFIIFVIEFYESFHCSPNKEACKSFFSPSQMFSHPLHTMFKDYSLNSYNIIENNV